MLCALVQSEGAFAFSPGTINSPADGSILTGTMQTFRWDGVTGATLYQLWVGSTPGAYDVGYFTVGGFIPATTVDATGLPADGRLLYVTLWTALDGMYSSTTATYTAVSGVPSAITMPANGSTLAGSSQTFQWTAGTASAYHQLWIGSSPGAYDVGYFPAGGTFGLSVTADGLPTDGRTLYATLWSLIGGAYQSTTAMYAASGGSAPVPAALTSPANGSTLSGADVTFQWNAPAGAMLYQVWVGNSPGAYDVGYFPLAGTMGTSTTATGLPTDGRKLYVRLWTAFDSGYLFTDYTFTAATVIAPPPSGTITWPANGASLAGAADTLHWSANPDAYGYQVWVGSTPGGFDVGYYPAGLTTATQIDMTGLPTDGRPLYITVWSALMTDGYVSAEATYYAASVGDYGLQIPAQPLPGPAQAFDFTSLFATMTIGNSVGSAEFGSGSVAGGQTTFYNLPIDGRTLYARVKWTVSGQQRFRDYTMTAAPAGPAAVMLSPANDWGLYSVGTSFSFTASDGASAYKIWAGTTRGGQEYGEFPSAGGTTSTTITVTVPAGTVPVCIRLWSLVGGVWYYRDYTYEWFSA